MTATKHVIFDLGAVLIEWDAALAFADVFTTRDAAESWMHEIGFVAWNRLQDGGRSFDDGLAAAKAEHGDLARHLKGYLAAFPVTIEKTVPGSWEILEDLATRDVPLYAITNWAAETWPAALELHPRLATVFKDIVVSGQVAQLKPDAAIYQLLMARNGLEAKDCIFIDDSAANVEGARAVGMDAIHFTGAEALARELALRGVFG
ncbi:HAD family hydrolase [Paracoccus aestuariivivens]|uniref:HAD-IA family hydrolase n=1 Tax=Paracoccus aestuariivivens TaxID=1820333 RepID=A0A6L6JEJ3_9RHOB|nr:HAD family phosphatase [Paracoccus aestuariivivens]MTH78331.1 HAD-IA family hydrolase [Paracoccus aestuariivivens]